MRNNLLTCCIFFIVSNSAAVTITTGTITPSVLCPGAAVSVPYTITGTFHAGNIFSAILSDSTGAFSGAPVIGTLASIASGTINAVIPSNTLPGSRYRILVSSNNPVFTGLNNGTNLTVHTVPSAVITSASAGFCQGSSLTLSANTGAGLSYQWKLNSNNISGATASTYSVLSAGTYSCAVSNVCTAVSNNISLSTCQCSAVDSTLNFQSAWYNTTQTTAYVFYTPLDTSVTYYIEYGLHGFTPGTGATPGIGGTIVTSSGSNSTKTFTGLSPHTVYDSYIRARCGSVFGSNSILTPNKVFRTLADCSTAQQINCNTNVTAVFHGWDEDIIYKFTPPVSGTYVLMASTAIVNFAYKPDSTGCTRNSWTNIGYASYGAQYSFGPLIAGVQYDLQAYSAYVDTITFHIEPPYCAAPTNVTATGSTPTSITLSWSGSSSDYYLEYGPQYFLPGTGTTSGPLGRVVGSGSTAYTVTGLSPTVNPYDFYVRQYCGAIQYSPNSLKYSASPQPCEPLWYYPGLGTTYGVGPFNGSGYWDCYGACGFGCYFYGQEQFVRWTPPNSGYYTATLVPSYFASIVNYVMFTKPSGLCDISGISCTSYDYTTHIYTLGPFIAGTSYDIVIDVDDTSYSSGNGMFLTINTATSVTSVSPSTLIGCGIATVGFFTTMTFNSGNIFTAQLSDANGNFASPTNIGTLASTSQGNINASIPSNVSSGTGYRIRVVSSNPVSTGSDNGSDITINSNPTVLNLKCFIQGYYINGGALKKVLYNEAVDTNSLSTNVDTVIVELHNSTSPYTVVESYKGVLQTNGTLTCNFSCNVNGHSYYIAVRHRNTIQTWSAAPVAFTGSTSYDFTTAATKAYGNNMIQMQAGKWAFYTGDVNQDENIDLQDFPIMDYGIVNGLFGYYASDLNGDGNVDLVDFPLLNANIILGIFSQHP